VTTERRPNFPIPPLAAPGKSAASGVDGVDLNWSEWHPTAQGDIGVFGGSVMGDPMGGSGVMADSGAGLSSISADCSALHSTTQVGISGVTIPEGIKGRWLGASPATPATAEPARDGKPLSSRSSTLLRRDCTMTRN
jgi:hypothetical protein